MQAIVVRGSILCDPTQLNPQQVEKFRPNPTRPNTTNNGAYSSVVTYFYTQSLCRTFCQRSILPHVLYCRYTCEKQCHYVIQKQAVQRNVKNVLSSNSESQQILVLLLQWTQPNPTHGSTQPMDNSDAGCRYHYCSNLLTVWQCC